jgi:hypothetical protein
MFVKAEARQQDKIVAQKEIRAIRAAEIERKRNEDEEKERRVEKAFRTESSSLNNTPSTTNRVTNLI